MSSAADVPALGAVAARFERAVARGVFPGAQLAVRRGGRLVLSHAAGIARGLRAEERAARAPVGRETRFACFSAGKPVVALALALLEQRGRLDPSAPVAAYFPEFAAHGKGAITVDDVLTHRAGVLLPDLCTRAADWPHPERVRAALVAARPVHPRGGLAYAPLEYGWILGEVLERIDGRPLPRFVAEEIARPAGLDALGFGAVAHERARVARSYWLGPARLVVAGANVAATFEEANNSDDFFAANLPGSGLVANAESLAAFYDLLLPSACVPGRPRLVDDARLRAWTAHRAFGWDRSSPRTTRGRPRRAARHARAFGLRLVGNGALLRARGRVRRARLRGPGARALGRDRHERPPRAARAPARPHAPRARHPARDPAPLTPGSPRFLRGGRARCARTRRQLVRQLRAPAHTRGAQPLRLRHGR